MAPTVDEILALLAHRKQELGPMHARAADITDTYNGDLAIALPELDKNERRAVPNLLNQGLNQLAMRVSSTVPDVFYPPDRPGIKIAEANARIRRQATLGWWEHSNIRLVMARRARHLLGYASSPVSVGFDFAAGVPRWRLRHPLHCFPGETMNPDDVDPGDCIFTCHRTLAWLQRQYPAHAGLLAKGPNATPDTRFELVEYTDGEVSVLAVIGQTPDERERSAGAAPHLELERVPNRAGVCLAVVPGRVTLDRPQGMFDGMVGLYQQQAALMALEYIAVKRGVFPDEWLVARPNENPVIVQEADGLRGVTGVVRGGDLKDMTATPGYRTDQMLNTLERAQRLEGGIPAEFGGESTTNVRTGRRGDSILSAVVDFPVQEAHNIFEVSLERENQVAVALAKAYAGNQRKSFYVNMKGAQGSVDYTPNTHFTSSTNTVSFPHAGADANSLVISIGQRIGVGTMSKALGRELDPAIDDPEREHRRVLTEALEAAVLTSVQQGATTGQIAPADVARIMELVLTTNSTLTEAVQQVQQEAQARQATAGPPGTPEGPVAPGAPEAQPGIGAPGSSAPAGSLGAPAPSPGEQGLAQLVGALRGGAAA